MSPTIDLVRSRLALAVAVAAAVVAASVAVPLVVLDGGAPRLTDAQYSRQVTAIYRSVAEAFRASGSGDLSRRLRAMTASLRRASASLATLRPPADAAQEHRILVAATHDYASQVDLVRASVDLGNPVMIATHLREVGAPVAIRAALRDLAAKGYRIPVTVAALR